MPKEIKLTKNKFAVVDDDMFEIVNRNKWVSECVHGTWYAYRRNGKKFLKMHRFILGLTDPRVKVDHMDGNGLNNQRSNLRICTIAENNKNCKIRKDNTSGRKGVTWFKPNQKWGSAISANGIRRFLGLFENIDDATRAYDKAAEELHGEFARTNSDIKGG